MYEEIFREPLSLKPTLFVVEALKAINAVGTRLTMPQRTNLAILMSGMILARTLTLSKICTG